MKKIISLLFFILIFISCDNCEDATLSVTNPYNHDASFKSSYTGSRTIAPGETVDFTENFVTEFTWEAYWTVYQADGTRDTYYGQGQMELGCGDNKSLTLHYDNVNGGRD